MFTPNSSSSAAPRAALRRAFRHWHRDQPEVASSTFTVASPAGVEWQVVAKNGPTDPEAWQPATGFEAWSFGFDTAAYGNGPHTIVVRVIHGGVELARQTAAVKLN